jgi:hypothetical protein
MYHTRDPTSFSVFVGIVLVQTIVVYSVLTLLSVLLHYDWELA